MSWNWTKRKFVDNANRQSRDFVRTDINEEATVFVHWETIWYGNHKRPPHTEYRYTETRVPNQGTRIEPRQKSSQDTPSRWYHHFVSAQASHNQAKNFVAFNAPIYSVQNQRDCLSSWLLMPLSFTRKLQTSHANGGWTIKFLLHSAKQTSFFLLQRKTTSTADPDSCSADKTHLLTTHEITHPTVLVLYDWRK